MYDLYDEYMSYQDWQNDVYEYQFGDEYGVWEAMPDGEPDFDWLLIEWQVSTVGYLNGVKIA